MEKRFVIDEGYEDIFVLEDGDNLRIGRDSAKSEALCLPKKFLRNDEQIRMAMWCYEAGYKQGDIHGQWFVRTEFKKLMDLQW